MSIKSIDEKSKAEFNAVVTHPLQSYEWGEFREKTGIKVIRRGLFRGDPSTSSGQKLVDGFQMTIHRIPHTSWNIGYIPKSNLPTKEVIEELQNIGREENCIFIQLEPNVMSDTRILGYKDTTKNNEKLPNILISQYPNIVPAAHPLFTKYTFILDLTKSEGELLKNMHPKTRYNIRVAQKHGVTVEENNSEEAFEEYLRLTKETTGRQRFYAHNESYHRHMWETLQGGSVKGQRESNKLSAHLLVARYTPSSPFTLHPLPLVTWVVFTFHDTLYYPYGASSSEHREVMASNLIMWEAIKFGKKLGLKKFDMWGSLDPHPDQKDPWYGFHRFKMGYGPVLTEFLGSYDLILNQWLYQLYIVADKIRWFYLRIKK